MLTSEVIEHTLPQIYMSIKVIYSIVIIETAE